MHTMPDLCRSNGYTVLNHSYCQIAFFLRSIFCIPYKHILARHQCEFRAPHTQCDTNKGIACTVELESILILLDNGLSMAGRVLNPLATSLFCKVFFVMFLWKRKGQEYQENIMSEMAHPKHPIPIFCNIKYIITKNLIIHYKFRIGVLTLLIFFPSLSLVTMMVATYHVPYYLLHLNVDCVQLSYHCHQRFDLNEIQVSSPKIKID